MQGNEIHAWEERETECSQPPASQASRKQSQQASNNKQYTETMYIHCQGCPVVWKKCLPMAGCFSVIQRKLYTYMLQYGSVQVRWPTTTTAEKHIQRCCLPITRTAWGYKKISTQQNSQQSTYCKRNLQGTAMAEFTSSI